MGESRFASTLLRTGTAVATTAVLGSVATKDINSAWYKSLDKPMIQPPGIVFPIVWTTLYTSIALSSADVIEKLASDPRRAVAFEKALTVNLVLNASWSWVFFRAHRLPLAVVVAAALAGSSTDLTRRAYHANPRAAAALTPYAAWCGFATVLTAAIWRRNR